jgi:hypothetical protein
VQVLWRLAQQEIAAPRAERAGRHARKRLARRDDFREISDVTVLKLRRTRHRHEDDEVIDGEGVVWTHRWAVSGHWRAQWYPTLKTHRQLWIAPYIKGPDDKPFVPKRRAVEFTR